MASFATRSSLASKSFILTLFATPVARRVEAFSLLASRPPEPRAFLDTCLVAGSCRPSQLPLSMSAGSAWCRKHFSMNGEKSPKEQSEMTHSVPFLLPLHPPLKREAISASEEPTLGARPNLREDARGPVPQLTPGSGGADPAAASSASLLGLALDHKH